jgi:beta-glucosidase
MISKKLSFFVITLLLTSPFVFATLNKKTSIWEKEVRFDWNSIDLSDEVFWKSLSFPENFQWGAATSAFQIEGVRTHDGVVKNNWTESEKVGHYYKNNVGPDHWNRYKEDVQLIANAGFNSYRLSIAWEKIEPRKGIFDQTALQHYIDLVLELKKQNIEPWICLYHFTHPVWFEAMGGFEKEENLIHFTKFCNYIFDALHGHVKFWSIYNEPIAYAMEAYFNDAFPPFKGIHGASHGLFNWKSCLKQSGIVMKNMLNAHVTLYQMFKEKDPTIQLGLIHMFHPLDNHNPSNPLETFSVKMGNYLMHDSVLNFFKTGKFEWFGMVSSNNKLAPESLDFIGVNYYCHELLQISPHTLTFKRHKARDFEERMPDNGKSIYPEGLYRSIVKASELELPIYITEIGIADSTDTMRNSFIKQHLAIIQQALKEGYDIRGCHWWTLLDSLGWKGKPDSKYGIYAVDEHTMDRRLRDGAKPLVNFLLSREK